MAALVLCMVVASALPLDGASGDQSASVSVDIEREGADGSAVAIYGVHVVAGETVASLGLSLGLPRWPGSHLVSGSPLAIDSVRLLGPGTLRTSTMLVQRHPVARRKPACWRSSGVDLPLRYWIETPAGTSSEVEIRARASHPLWPDTRQGLGLTTFESEDFPTPENLLWSGTGPEIGARGVHIQMRKSDWKGSKSGATPLFMGSTEPVLRFARVFLRTVRVSRRRGVSLQAWTNPSSDPMPSVRTDAQGHFRVPSIELPQVGAFSVMARVGATDQFAADWNCGPFFELEGKPRGG
jgi:hypothetical protein